MVVFAFSVVAFGQVAEVPMADMAEEEGISEESIQDIHAQLENIPIEYQEKVSLYIFIQSANADFHHPNEWLRAQGKTVEQVWKEIPEDWTGTEEDLRRADEEFKKRKIARRIEEQNAPEEEGREPNEPDNTDANQEDKNGWFDAEGKRIPNEWVEELKAEGVEMYNYEQMMQRRKQGYIDNAKAGKTARENDPSNKKESAPNAE